MPAAATAAFTFVSRRLQPAALALLLVSAAQLAGAVASCTPEPLPMGVARVALRP